MAEQRTDGKEFITGLELQAAKQRLEATLFTAEKPVGVRYLARRIGQSSSATRRLLESLKADYASRGVHLMQDGQKYFFSIPERLVPETVPAQPKVGLSRQGLEVLALIIAKGALSRRELCELRGVRSDKAITSLVGRHLLTSKRDYLKKALVYDLSDELLERWGFASRSELLQDIESRRRGL